MQPPPSPSITHSTPMTSRFALWNLGFRPFYLLASIFAALSVVLWVMQYRGLLTFAYLPGPIWHAHEMLFGYTMAVVAGFLLTAVRVWTNQPTPSGMPLMALALLWIAGRVLVLLPYPLLAAFVNAAFPVAVAAAIAKPLVRGGNKRNYIFVGVLLLLGAAVLTIHLSYQGHLQFPVRSGLQAALDVILFVVAVVAGRVIPMFTNNGVPGAGAERVPIVEKLALGSILLLIAADILQLQAGWLAALTAVCAVAQSLRLYLWRPWRTLRTPLVWVLHLAYAWIVVSLLLRASAAAGLVSETLAVHAFTIGAIGGMTIGMMTRTARGHTGRPLAADSFEVTAFVLVQLAAVVRVFGAMSVPELYGESVLAAGALWSAAFALFAIRYWPVLTRPRIDGKPG